MNAMYNIDLEDVSDLDEFRSAFAFCFRGAIRKAVREEGIDEKSNHEFLILKFNEILDNKKSLSQILAECSSFIPDASETGHEKVKELLVELNAEAMRTEFAMYLAMDAEEHPVAAVSAAQLTPAAAAASDEVPEDTIAAKLHRQISQLEEPRVTKDEMVLVLQHQFKQQHPEYNGCFLVADDVYASVDMAALNELSGIARTERLIELHTEALTKKIDDLIKHSDGDRVQIIIRSGVHYTALDVNKEQRTCFVFDAVGDLIKNRFHALPRHAESIDRVIDTKAVVMDRGDRVSHEHIQKDGSSCPLYALDMSLAASCDATLHQRLLKAAEHKSHGLSEVTWFDLPPAMVKLCQSSAILDSYMKINPDSRPELMAMTHNNTPQHALTRLKERYAADITTIAASESEHSLTSMITADAKDTHTVSFGT